MKKILVIIISLFVVVFGVVAQETTWEIIDDGEVDEFFSYVSIACNDKETALSFVDQWSTNDDDNWVTISCEEIDLLTRIDSESLFREELGNRIGVYLYFYTQADVKVSVVYENGMLYITSDSQEILDELKQNKEALILGILET